MQDLQRSSREAGPQRLVPGYRAPGLNGGPSGAGEAMSLGQRVRLYIDNSLHQHSLSPQTIQQAFQMSRPTLYRMFEEEGGLVRYIRHCRLRDATSMLQLLPHCTVIEIAYCVGFSSASDFSRAFRRQYGMTPSAFRRIYGVETVGLSLAAGFTPSVQTP